MVSGAMDSLAQGFGQLLVPAPGPRVRAESGPRRPAAFHDCLESLQAADTTRDRDVSCLDAPLRATEAGGPAQDLGRPGAPAPLQRQLPRDPVRLHLYHDPASGTCQVWIGLDRGAGDSIGLPVAALLQEAASNDGTRLVRLVCNGREIELPQTAAPRRRTTNERRA